MLSKKWVHCYCNPYYCIQQFSGLYVTSVAAEDSCGPSLAHSPVDSWSFCVLLSGSGLQALVFDCNSHCEFSIQNVLPFQFSSDQLAYIIKNTNTKFWGFGQQPLWFNWDPVAGQYFDVNGIKLGVVMWCGATFPSWCSKLWMMYAGLFMNQVMISLLFIKLSCRSTHLSCVARILALSARVVNICPKQYTCVDNWHGLKCFFYIYKWSNDHAIFWRCSN